jgi:hypothetical protein
MKIVFYWYFLNVGWVETGQYGVWRRSGGGEKKGWGVVEEIELVTDHSTARERGDNRECF